MTSPLSLRPQQKRPLRFQESSREPPSRAAFLASACGVQVDYIVSFTCFAVSTLISALVIKGQRRFSSHDK